MIDFLENIYVFGFLTNVVMIPWLSMCAIVVYMFYLLELDEEKLDKKVMKIFKIIGGGVIFLAFIIFIFIITYSKMDDYLSGIVRIDTCKNLVLNYKNNLSIENLEKINGQYYCGYSFNFGFHLTGKTYNKYFGDIILNKISKEKEQKLIEEQEEHEELKKEQEYKKNLIDNILKK